MIIAESDLEFNFSDALDIRKFDDPRCHGLSHCMKAIDFIVELNNAYLFIEIKDPSNPKSGGCNLQKDKEKLTNGEMLKCLQLKFRDTFIYRWAEEKLDKPIYFLALITLEQPLLISFNEKLKTALPSSQANSWQKPLVKSCQVLNLEFWNRNFPKWQVRRLSTQTN